LPFYGQDGIARTVIMVVTKINKSEREDELRSTIELTFESNLVMIKIPADR